MSPEETLLDPPRLASNGREDLHRRTPCSEDPPPLSQFVPAVRPVRTIVLNRAPTPVRPAGEREAVRLARSQAGPERLTLREVGVAYAGKEAVRAVSLSIHQGEVLALIGPSGCGKNTLLRTLNRITELTSGA